MIEQRQFMEVVNGYDAGGATPEELFDRYVDRQLIGTPQEVIVERIKAIQEEIGRDRRPPLRQP